MLGISTTSWRCHFPKGYTVRFTWLQEGSAEPRWTSTLDTDTLPSPDGYFLTLYTQSPPSRPAEDKSPTKVEIGFRTPYEGTTTYFYYKDTTSTGWGTGEPKVGEDFVLWTVDASPVGPPKPLLKMIMRIDRK